MKTCDLNIYTSNGVLTFEVEATTDNFQDTLAEALEGGTVVLDTTDGSRLVLNAINVVAIEVCEVVDEDEIATDTPPVSKNGGVSI